MKRSRWQQTQATIELCEPTHANPDEIRYAITVSYQIEGELFVTDALSDQPLEEGSEVVLEYDRLDPRRNSLNHPRRERKAFLIAVAIAGVIVLILLVIALFGL